MDVEPPPTVEIVQSAESAQVVDPTPKASPPVRLERGRATEFLRKELPRLAIRQLCYTGLAMMAWLPASSLYHKAGPGTGSERLTRIIAAQGIEAFGAEVVVDGLVKAVEVAIKRDIRDKSPELESRSNPERRPLLDLVQEGVSQYGKPVYYEEKRSREHDDYIDKMADLFLQSGITIADIKKYFDGDPDANRKIHGFKDTAIMWLGQGMKEGNDGFASLRSVADRQYTQTSGFAQAVLAYESQLEQRAHANPAFESRIDDLELNEMLDQEVRSMMDGIIAQLHRQMHEKAARSVTNTADKISSSAVLALFLERNEGNLSQSIHDTGIFFKLLTRSTNMGGNYGTGFSWLAEMQFFKDEFSIHAEGFGLDHRGEDSFPKYSFEVDPDFRGKDLEVSNLAGSPYHIYYMAHLLQYYPAETVKVALLSQQLIDFKKQGRVKTLADISALHELEALDAYFKTFSDPIHVVQAKLERLTAEAKK
jgi:hypothetical protein